MKKTSAQSHFILPINTDDGIFLAHYSEQGLRELDFPRPISAGRVTRRAEASGTGGSSRVEKNHQKGNAVPAQVRAWHKLAATALKQSLSGHPPRELPPLDWSGTTAFQQSVWREMLKIPYGETRSYGQLAKSIRNPAAVRAVGGACGANPIPVLVPCHRVLAAHGKIGGFSSGLDRKRLLLRREGVVL